MNARRLALMGLLLTTAGCNKFVSSTEPEEPDAIELNYYYTNTVEGRCFITPTLAINDERVVLQEVQLAEYGNIIYEAPADAYWYGSMGQEMRVYAAYGAMIWQWYELNGEREVKTLKMRCRG